MPDSKCSRCGAPAEDSDLCATCAALDLTARKPAPAGAYNVACGLSLAGDTEVAVDWFAISMWRGIRQQRCPTSCQYDRGGTFFEHIDRDTDLNNIREDDRFKQVLEFYASRRPR